MNILKELEHDASGLAVLQDWLGEGGVPVDKDKAAERAQVCVRCAENTAPLWWEKAKDMIAWFIRKQLEFKHRMELSTEHDDKLHMCACCGCCARLKVHVPAEHIKAHTTQETMDSFPAHCWIKKELQ
jgi:hypothetical protein